MVAIFDGPVHSLGLTIRPGVIRLCQLVLDAVLCADTIKDVGAEISPRGSVPVFWQIGESHAIVGEYRVDLVGKGFDDVPQEVGTVHLACVLITAGETTSRLFRRLELGSNSRRCAGAAVKNVCHNAPSDSRVRIAS
jgi:hypothetical protein